MPELLTLLLISVGINLFMFVIAYIFRTDKFTDISYALTFITLAIFGLYISNFSIPSIIISAMIFLWASRLGFYLLQRIRKIGKDERFDDKRNNFLKFLSFWLLQGITVWVVMISANLFYLFGSSVFAPLSSVGILIWFIGLLIETISDYQKYTFINNPKNKGKWVDIGLWKYSRHPNYFGEILVWLGTFLFTMTGLPTSLILFGLISPVYITVLLIFVSGIPILEKSADKRWGDDKEYQEYKRKTSILVILPRTKKLNGD